MGVARCGAGLSPPMGAARGGAGSLRSAMAALLRALLRPAARGPALLPPLTRPLLGVRACSAGERDTGAGAGAARRRARGPASGRQGLGPPSGEPTAGTASLHGAWHWAPRPCTIYGLWRWVSGLQHRAPARHRPVAWLNLPGRDRAGSSSGAPVPGLGQ